MKLAVIPSLILAALAVVSTIRAAQAPIAAPAVPPVTTASIEGVAVRQGTRDPIPSIEVELTRVEGTTASPLSAGFLEAYTSAQASGGFGGAAPPPVVAPEVLYAKTGPDGKFAFKNLKAGKYKLVALKVGGAYYPAEYGQRDPRQRGIAFPVADGEALKDIRIEMVQPAAITGRVVDADGEPLGHVLVFALDPQYREGGRRVLNIEQVMPTDERGEYRLHWLVPGPHYVAALIEDPRRRTISLDPIPPGRRGPTERAENPYVVRRTLESGEIMDEAYQLVYFGGTVDPAYAKPIDAVAGGTYPSADISMAAGKLRSWHIRGVVIDGTTAKPAGGAMVRAIPRAWSPNAMVLNATADADGVFDLIGASPGSYMVFATSISTTPGAGPNISPELAAAAAAAGINIATLIGNAPGATTGIVSLPVEVSNADVEKLQLTTSASVQAAGRVMIEGRVPSDNDPEIARIRITLTQDPDIIATPPAMAPLPPPIPGTPNTAPRPANGQVLANGSFTLHTWLGNTRMSITGIPADSYVKSIRMGPFDVMSDGLRLAAAPDSPLEVVLGTDGGTVSGVVVEGPNQKDPSANVVVALVPELPALRRRPEYYRTATTDYKGSFQLQNIPPGEYKVFVWEFAQGESWQNPEFLRAYENSGKVIRVDERSKQNLTMTAIPK